MSKASDDSIVHEQSWTAFRDGSDPFDDTPRPSVDFRIRRACEKMTGELVLNETSDTTPQKILPLNIGAAEFTDSGQYRLSKVNWSLCMENGEGRVTLSKGRQTWVLYYRYQLEFVPHLEVQLTGSWASHTSLE